MSFRWFESSPRASASSSSNNFPNFITSWEYSITISLHAVGKSSGWGGLGAM
uniref:Uncharacterized protein n=1 Tax=Rhizophora mucronata TaxID=61149 RepID=A0A2P2QT12_RHIMU